MSLKGHGNEADFLGFCRNWFLTDPSYNLSSRSDFGFKFAEIFVIEKRLAESPTQRDGERLKENSASCRLSYSPSQGVAMVSRGVAIQIF
jgi:hypothetical protein